MIRKNKKIYQHKDFIISNLKISEKLRSKIENYFIDNQLDEEDLTELHELCMDFLQEKGFDEKYDTNQEGVICEEIIDSIFELEKTFLTRRKGSP